jgi:hypothetical protein
MVVMLNGTISVTSSTDQIIAHLLCHSGIYLIEGTECSFRVGWTAAAYGFLKTADLLRKKTCKNPVNQRR